MHVLFLSHYFPPEVNAPASRTFENARRWVKAGHKVTVLTCAPNHPNGILYPGFRNKLWQREEMEGVEVLRVKTYLGANKGFVHRTLNFISYMISATLLCGMVKGVDLVVSTSPQFFCGLAGYPVSRLKGCRWVLEVRDLWPESIVAVEAVKPGRVIRMLEKVENFMYRKADHIVSVTRSFIKHFNKRGIGTEKISVVTNGADLGAFNPLPRDRELEAAFGLEGKFVVSYVGTHGMAHSLETVLAAAELLKEQKEIVFLLAGDGAEREKLLAARERLGLDNVLMLPQQPKTMVPRLLALSDATMVLLKKSDLFKTVIPSKMFEAMAMERSLIFGVEGESRAIFESAECGIAIEPENERELAEAVRSLARDRERSAALGKKGGDFVRKYYDRDVLARFYGTIIQAVAESKPAPRWGQVVVRSGE